MSLLNVDDAMPSGRVLPKVFADVPSQEELRQAKDDVRRAKANAGRMIVVVLVLLGALIAVGALAAFHIAGEPGRIETALNGEKEKVIIANDRADKAAADATKARDELTESLKTYTRVNTVATQDREVSDILKAIQDKLAQPAYAGARNLGTPEERAALNAFAWSRIDMNADWTGSISTDLGRRLLYLKSLKGKVDAWVPPDVRPPPPPCDPRVQRCP